LASLAPFFLLIVDHLLCPDINYPLEIYMYNLESIYEKFYKNGTIRL